MLSKSLLNRRVVSLEGAYNMRDLGGLAAGGGRRVKRGLVYRSDDLTWLTDGDLAKLSQLGLKTIVDFRSHREQRRSPSKYPASVAQRHDLAIDPGDLFELTRAHERTPFETMRILNELLVKDAQPQYTAFFEILSEPNESPLLFHCSAGKDRTGLAAALFLASCGVDAETIYDDYALSTEFLKAKYRADVAENPWLAPLVAAKREYLEAARRVIDDTYGGLENYLTSCLGIDPERIRALYTEPVN